MDSAVIACSLLCLLCGSAAAHVPRCTPTDYTLYVEKPECDYCVAINTTICMGFCLSVDSNAKELLGLRRLVEGGFQKGCTYDRVEYRTATLPGCPDGSDPLFTYPVALSCHCGSCKTASNECVERTGGGRDGAARCTKELRHIYPPEAADYMLPF